VSSETVIQFDVHSTETAPEPSRATLESARRAFGFVPNLLGVLANSPVALRAYTSLAEILEEGSLTPAERQVVLLSTSVANRCQYCVAAHSALAIGADVPPDVVEAIRDGRTVPAGRLGALSTLARRLVESRGWLEEHEVTAFVNAGFEEAQLLEVITALAMKTLSNYTNHLAQTPLDAPFRKTAWEAPGDIRRQR
jgi:uncharacterized peroxidase-related enzyme